MAKIGKPARHTRFKKAQTPHPVTPPSQASAQTKRSALSERTNQPPKLQRPHSLFLPPPKVYTGFQRATPGLPSFKVQASPSNNKRRGHQSPGNVSRISLSDLVLPSSPALSTDSTDSAESSTSPRPREKRQTGSENPNPFFISTPKMEPIRTVLRIKPSDENQGQTSYLDILSNTEARLTPPPDARSKKPAKYKFTRVLDVETPQSTVFEETCLPLLASVLRRDNFDALLFGYGVSNSGKTHSIIGSNQPGQAGVLPRSLEVIFRSIERYVQDTGEADLYRPVGYLNVERIDMLTQESQMGVDTLASQLSDFDNLAKNHNITVGDFPRPDHADIDRHVVHLPGGMDYAIWISCAELYTEKIYDLLAEPPKSSTFATGGAEVKRPVLTVQTEAASGQKYVGGLKEIRVRTLEEALIVLQAGLKQRQIFTTLLNHSSSRSHSIFTIKIVKSPQFCDSAAQSAKLGKTSVSRLSIVDLAGSERLRNTNNSGQRLKEAGDINNSLMYLSHCMEVLRLNQTRSPKNRQAVPYQNSKLTQIFQNALEGRSENAGVCMIINANPGESDFDETTQVLRFASAAMDVTTVRQAVSKEDLASIQKIPRSSDFSGLSSARGSNSASGAQSERNMGGNTADKSLGPDMRVQEMLQNQIEDLQRQLKAMVKHQEAAEVEKMDRLAGQIVTSLIKTESQSRATTPTPPEPTSKEERDPGLPQQVDMDESDDFPRYKHELEATARLRNEAFEARDEALRERAEALRKRDEFAREMDEALHDRDEASRQKDEALRQKEDALQEKSEALREKDDALQEKSEALRQKNEALRERDEALREKDKALREKELTLRDSEDKRMQLCHNMRENVDFRNNDLDRLQLKRDLEAANSTIAAWQAWHSSAFATAPGYNPVLADRIIVAQGKPGDAIDSVQIVNAAAVGMKMMEAIHDAGERVVEQAARDEDFLELADLAMSHQEEEDVANRDDQDRRKGQGEVHDTDEVEGVSGIGDDDLLLDTHNQAIVSVEAARSPGSRETRAERTESEPRSSDHRNLRDSTDRLLRRASSTNTNIIATARPAQGQRLSLPAVVIEVPSRKHISPSTPTCSTPSRGSSGHVERRAGSPSRIGGSSRAEPPVKRARLSMTPVLSVRQDESDYEPSEEEDEVISTIKGTSNAMKSPSMAKKDRRRSAESVSLKQKHDAEHAGTRVSVPKEELESKGKQVDDLRSPTAHRTPAKERRTSLGPPYSIDDHINTPVAELSPIRPLYPKLSPLSQPKGEFELKASVGHQRPCEPSLSSGEDHENPFLDRSYVRVGSSGGVNQSPEVLLLNRRLSLADVSGEDEDLRDLDNECPGRGGVGAVGQDSSCTDEDAIEDGSTHGTKLHSLSKSQSHINQNQSLVQGSEASRLGTPVRGEESDRGQEMVQKQMDAGGQESSTSEDQVAMVMMTMTPGKKRRKLRAKMAVFEEEMEETIGMSPPPPTNRGRKKTYGRR